MSSDYYQQRKAKLIPGRMVRIIKDQPGEYPSYIGFVGMFIHINDSRDGDCYAVEFLDMGIVATFWREELEVLILPNESYN